MSRKSARREHLRKMDAAIGVINPKAQCTCMKSTAGDHCAYSQCNRHGVPDLVIQECCYCEDSKPRVLDAQGNCPCFEGYSKKHAAFDQYLYDTYGPDDD